MSEAEPLDTDRLKLHPEVRLREWERAARPIADLVDAPVETLGRELSRSVLVHPRQPLDGGTSRLVERLTNAHAVTPEQRGPIADALNALACVGADAKVRPDWLRGLTAIEPPFPGRLAAGFAALALGDWRTASYVATPPYDTHGGLEFPGDVHALLGYAIWTVRLGASLVYIQRGLQRLAEELDVLCASGQLDEATVLWIARFAFQALDKAPLHDVAACAHDWLWSAPTELDQARAQPPEFPIGATLGGGAFRIEHLLCGARSATQLYRGVEVATGAQLLIALDYFRSKHDVAELRAAVDYDAPGIHTLAYVGHLDGRRDIWTVVERAPSGTWLPTLIGPANPWTAPRKAIELGVSAGVILLGAHRLGWRLFNTRPEVMWAEQRDGRYAVTGIASRCFALFARSYGDANTHPLFFHHYRDPYRDDTFDDRSQTFSLAVMVAQWSMGVYPLLQKWAQETADHMPIEAPPKLRDLLERGLAPVRGDRPSLSEFVAELARISV